MTSTPVGTAVQGSPRRGLRLLVVTSEQRRRQDGEWLLDLLDATPRVQAVVVSLGEEPLLADLEARGVPIERLPPLRRLLDTLPVAARLRRSLLRLDPDAVLADGALAAAALRPALAVTGHVTVRAEHEHEHEHATRAVLRLSRGLRTVVRPAELRGRAGWAHRLLGQLAVEAGRAGAGIDPEAGPPVSLVVPVWNEGALVDRLVDTLLPQLRPRDELVLVDDASSDDTGDRIDRAAARHPQLQGIRRTRNGRAGAARNTGVAAARHEHLAFTDAGCHWGPGWLDAMRVPFAEDPPPDLVAGVYRVSRRDPFEAAMAVGCYPDVRDVRRTGPLTALWSRLFGRRFDASRPAGRAVAATRSAIQRAGGWPEGQIAHEDVDLAREIADQGLRCVMTTDADLLWDQAGPRGTWAMYVRYGRGDALASDRQALIRDALRAGAYVLGPLGLGFGGRLVRAGVLLGAAAYFSVPLARARDEQRPLATAALVAPAVALKDLAKMWGALQVLLDRSERRGSA